MDWNAINATALTLLTTVGLKLVGAVAFWLPLNPARTELSVVATSGPGKKSGPGQGHFHPNWR